MTTIEKLYPAIRGHRITTDSRQIIRGDIFIALKGENFDGNRYAAAALEQGAALAIIDNADYLSPGCELVADSLLFLQQLAHYHRQQLHIPILGITGTNGKTTTKELCHAVLSKKFKTFATQGNFNNHIGVPLTLLSMDETTEFGIVEMGANRVKSKRSVKLPIPISGLSPISAMPTWKVSVATKILSPPKKPSTTIFYRKTDQYLSIPVIRC